MDVSSQFTRHAIFVVATRQRNDLSLSVAAILENPCAVDRFMSISERLVWK